MPSTNILDPKQNRNPIFFECKTCNGYGFLLSGSGKTTSCTRCGGKKSLVGVYGGKILYWSRLLSDTTLFEEKIVRGIKRIRIGILISFAALGVIMVVSEFWRISKTTFDLTELLTDRSLELAIFYTSLVADIYVWYLLNLTRIIRHPLPWRSHRPDDALQLGAIRTWEEALRTPAKTQADVSEFVNQEAQGIIDASYDFAKQYRHVAVEPAHILAVLMPTKEVRLIFGRLGLPAKPFMDRLQRLLARLIQGPGSPHISHAWQQTMITAYQEAFEAQRDQITLLDLMIGAVKSDRALYEIFFDLEVDIAKLKHVAEWIQTQRKMVERLQHWEAEASLKPKKTMNRAMTAKLTPALDSMSQDWTIMARGSNFYPLIGRKKEMEELLRALQEEGGSALIVGPSGSGKTALIQGLSERMAAEFVPANLQDRRLVALDVGSLVAGAGGVGVAEGRLLQAMNEIAAAGNIILVIEDIDSMFTSAGGAAREAANILLKYISQGVVKVIATATTENYQRYLQNNTSLVRRFKRVVIEEADFDESMRVLQSRTGIFEYRHKAYFSYDALEKAIHLTAKYIHDRYLPEKAIDVLEQACIYASETRGENTIVTGEDIAQIIAQRTNIPVTKITEDESRKLLSLEDQIHERMIDQVEAVQAVASALRRARGELRDESKPIANFLFLGPTGVGKTELAKTVAESYFGDERSMVRIDMSEYQDKASIYRLIGAPAGSGGESGGYLTEAIRQTPFTLLLLDELEKAHPDILNIFLQVMDDGRLTDALGRTIDFTQTIIVATSNAGAQMIQEGMRKGASVERIKEQLMEEELQKYYRPEFLNRFDAIVVFKPLSPDDIFQIAKLMLKRIAKSLETKGMQFRATDAAVRELAQIGYDPKFGARPMRRVIQNSVEDALAKLLLTQKLGRRDAVVLEAGGKLRIEKAEVL